MECRDAVQFRLVIDGHGGAGHGHARGGGPPECPTEVLGRHSQHEGEAPLPEFKLERCPASGVAFGPSRQLASRSGGVRGSIAFTACFAVRTILSIIGVASRAGSGLHDTRFGRLVATPILTGSVTRLVLGAGTE